MYRVEETSDAISRDMNSLLTSSTFKSDGEFAKIKELISSDPCPNYENKQSVIQKENSFFTNLFNGNGCPDFLDPMETESSKSNLLDLGTKQQAEEDLRNTLKHPNLETSSSIGFMNSSLIKQNTSPPWFLSSTTTGNDLSSRLPSCLGFLPQIMENGNEMNDSTFNALKRGRDLDTQNFDSQNTSSEMGIVEDDILQESIPCKIRAKRGFATHPRSIAERVRRTRISERIKKLQELFPNIDKQTNTADMLDLALEYIKDLQEQVQGLNDAQEQCTCSSK